MATPVMLTVVEIGIVIAVPMLLPSRIVAPGPAPASVTSLSTVRFSAYAPAAILMISSVPALPIAAAIVRQAAALDWQVLLSRPVVATYQLAPASYAPVSHAPPCGRGTPRWSVACGQPAPVSTAGLLGSSA